MPALTAVDGWKMIGQVSEVAQDAGLLVEEQPDGAGVFWRAAQSVPLPLGLGSRLTKWLPRPSGYRLLCANP